VTDATQPKEPARSLDAIGWLDTLSRDFKYALRTLRRDLGFAPSPFSSSVSAF
jgi:hypothetical protein